MVDPSGRSFTGVAGSNPAGGMDVRIKYTAKKQKQKKKSPAGGMDVSVL
jgi:hypothetical protein